MTPVTFILTLLSVRTFSVVVFNLGRFSLGIESYQRFGISDMPALESLSNGYVLKAG